mmetsp:Transcript_111707/g.266466  ORF Transcript_111707/g.266466 Transcript_111707/m.266466 type:complete len:312 (-) Transcript_111707:269-1204(-)
MPSSASSLLGRLLLKRLHVTLVTAAQASALERGAACALNLEGNAGWVHGALRKRLRNLHFENQGRTAAAAQAHLVCVWAAFSLSQPHSHAGRIFGAYGAIDAGQGRNCCLRGINSSLDSALNLTSCCLHSCAPSALGFLAVQLGKARHLLQSRAHGITGLLEIVAGRIAYFRAQGITGLLKSTADCITCLLQPTRRRIAHFLEPRVYGVSRVTSSNTGLLKSAACGAACGVNRIHRQGAVFGPIDRREVLGRQRLGDRAFIGKQAAAVGPKGEVSTALHVCAPLLTRLRACLLGPVGARHLVGLGVEHALH